MTEKTQWIRTMRSQGKSYKEISEITGLSAATISYHVSENGKHKVHERNKSNYKKWISELRFKKGGKCFKCGYNKCQEALEFHHLNPSEKDKNISNLIRISLARAEKEAEKCILVCANCHREIHNGQVG